MLEWARENNCPWSGSTTLHAALNNHLEILKWARQQQSSCPWWNFHVFDCVDDADDDYEHWLNIAKPSTLLWLAQQGAPLPDEAHAIACSSAVRLTHAYIPLRALLPAELVYHILALCLE